MASSIPVSRSISLASNYVRNAPLTLGVNNDPALSIADWVRQFILGPPFAWRWNRRAPSQIPLIPGQTDYPGVISSLGWIEKANLIFPVGIDTNAGQSVELEIVMNMARESVPNQPTKICALLDDDQNDITLRLMPPPDKPYLLELIFQVSAPTFQTPNDLWAPIPDYLSNLYNAGMLAKAYEYMGDERFLSTMTSFMRQVIAANGALDETQANIFLSDQINTLRERQSVQLATQSGRTGRGNFQG